MDDADDADVDVPRWSTSSATSAIDGVESSDCDCEDLPESPMTAASSIPAKSFVLVCTRGAMAALAATWTYRGRFWSNSGASVTVAAAGLVAVVLVFELSLEPILDEEDDAEEDDLDAVSVCNTSAVSASVDAGLVVA